MQESAGSDGSGRTGQAGGSSTGAAVELALAGLDPSDLGCMLLKAPDGTTFRLRADSALRSALRTLGPATGALAPTPVPLRPREIQARIRAGESAADVAADAGVPVEQVQRYEGPVLAERAHIAERARQAGVRSDGDRQRLVDVVKTRLGARGVDPTTVAWDAWRRDEARWSVLAAYRVGGRDKHAQWLFDPRSQVLEPMDEEARWLCAVQDTAPRTGRRLSAVRVYGFSDDEADEVTEAPPPLPEPADPEEIAARTMELLDALRDRRGRRVPMMDLDDDESWGEDDEDELLNALLDLPPAAHPPAQSPSSPLGPGAFNDEADDPGAAPEAPRLRMLRAAITGEVPVLGVSTVPPAGPASGPSTGPSPGLSTGPSPEDVTGVGAAPGTSSPTDDEDDHPGTDHRPPDHRRPDREGPTSTGTGTGTGSVEVPPRRPTTRREARLVQAAPPPDTDSVPSRPDVPTDTAAPTAEDDDDAPVGRTRRRPKVPSWDEILFGSPRLD